MSNTNCGISSTRLGYSTSNAPVIGGLVDYIATSIQYVRNKSFIQGESLHLKKTHVSLSSSFLAITCLLLGLVCNVKFEVVTFTDEPLRNDMHHILMSREDNLYIDEIDVSKVILCLEVSDALAIIISSILIWLSPYANPQLRDYLFLPWFGVVLRGVLTRQAPTAAALLYTVAVVSRHLNPLFLWTFSSLIMLEARVWLEVARVVVMRWEKVRPEEADNGTARREVPSVEVGNFVY